MTEQRQAPQPPPQPWFDAKTGNATQAFYKYIIGEFSATISNVNSGVAQAQAAAAAAQATANAAAQQANDVGSGALPFSASISPSGVTGSGKVNISTEIATCTPSGGVAPYTYLWSFVSGDAVTVLTPTANTTRFRSNSSAISVYSCTVTDSTPGTPLVAVANVGVSITSTSE